VQREALHNPNFSRLLSPLQDGKGDGGWDAKPPRLDAVLPLERLGRKMKDKEFIRTLYNIFPQAGREVYRLV
jgi:hypothetical protein